MKDLPKMPKVGDTNWYDLRFREIEDPYPDALVWLWPPTPYLGPISMRAASDYTTTGYWPPFERLDESVLLVA